MKAKKRTIPKLKVNQVWFIRLPGSISLTKQRIIDKTSKVVEIIPVSGYCSSLYLIEDLEFVEKVF